jgi:hypothetical protein
MYLVRGVVLLAALCAVATAAPVIEFLSTSAGGHSGSISYDPRFQFGAGGTGNTAVGQGIDVDFLTGTGTAQNDGVAAACFNCVLDFRTGATINDTSSNGDSWSFSGGGFFRVTGGFDLNNNGVLDATDIQPGTALLTGVFNSPVTITTPGGPDLKFTSATLINTMDNRVDWFFGTPGQGVYDGLYTQSFGSSRARLANHSSSPNYDRWRFSTYTPPGGSTPTGMKDGNVVNTLVVPEPVSVLLSGTVAGILVLCLRLRRRMVVR